MTLFQTFDYVSPAISRPISSVGESFLICSGRPIFNFRHTTEQSGAPFGRGSTTTQLAKREQHHLGSLTQIRSAFLQVFKTQTLIAFLRAPILLSILPRLDDRLARLLQTYEEAISSKVWILGVPRISKGQQQQ